MAFSSFVQQWADIGIKAGYGYNILLNFDIMNDDNFSYEHSWGNSWGGKLGWNFNYNNEVVVEVMSTQFNQKFTYSIDGVPGSKKFKMRTLDIPLIWRNNKDKIGSYSEIGPQISIVRRASDNGNDVVDQYKHTYFSIVAGIGNYVAGTDNTGLAMGIRLIYALQDIVSDEGAANGYPTAPYGNAESSKKASNPLSVLFMIELNHDFGYLISSGCQQRKKLILFNL